MYTVVFKVIKWCVLIDGYKRFEGIYGFHLQIEHLYDMVVSVYQTIQQRKLFVMVKIGFRWRKVWFGAAEYTSIQYIVISVQYFHFIARFYVGQNVYQASTKGVSPNGQQDWQSAVQAWYSEVKSFSKNSVNPFQWVPWQTGWRSSELHLGFSPLKPSGHYMYHLL
jgi:hypothetical protein